VSEHLRNGRDVDGVWVQVVIKPVGRLQPRVRGKLELEFAGQRWLEALERGEAERRFEAVAERVEEVREEVPVHEEVLPLRDEERATDG
jgi:hypothetical protein